MMKTTVSSKGQIVLPAELRQQDDVEPGQEFDVERLDRGEYRLVRRHPPAAAVRVDRFAVTYLVDANVLSEPTRPVPDPGVVDWLRTNEAELTVDPFVLGELRFGILLLPKGRRRTAEGLKCIYRHQIYRKIDGNVYTAAGAS